jgi:hypothetical protein
MAKTGPGGKSGAGHTHLIPANLTGAEGPAGPSGPTGATGATGAAGPNVTILTHTGIPTSGDGAFTKGQCAMDTNNVFYVCTVAGTPGTWAYLALSYAAGSIASNVTLSSVSAKILDTASLAVGIWNVDMFATLEAASGASGVELECLVDSATATFQGSTSGGATASATGYTERVVIGFIAVVTVAGTLQLKGTASTGGSALAATTQNLWTNATGYRAVRIG